MDALVLSSIYIYIYKSTGNALYSPYGLLGVVRDSFTIAWDTLCQEVVMLAKEGEIGGVPSAQNKSGRFLYFLQYININGHAMISVLSFWFAK